MLIRDATDDDAEAIAELANGLAKVTNQGPGAMTIQKVQQGLIRGDGLSVIVGEIDGAVQGYALYSVAYETAQAARGLYLSDLYVAERARRSGLARALMAELAQRCVADQGEFIWWIMLPGNKPAARFYASLGARADDLAAMEISGPAFRALLDRPL